MEWIISANPTVYAIQKAFSERNQIDWRQTASQQVGDIVYIYVGKPVQALLYLAMIEQVDIPFEERLDDTEYWLNKTELENSRNRNFMRLRILESYSETTFPLQHLKEYGLKAAPQGPIWNKKELFAFLNRVTVDQSEEVFKEGKSALREHFTRERNRKLIEAAKERFLKKEGRLYCEACEFDFAKTYGGLGEHFIEAHHTLPVSQMGEDHVSKVSDLALLCSNCHRMIHRKMPWLTVEELRSVLGR